MASIEGDDDPNVLPDTAGDDVINGYGGDDVISISGGFDSANGGQGYDTLIVDYSWTSDFVRVSDRVYITRDDGTGFLAFVTAYNFAKHLKALRWRTHYQVICEA